MSLEILGISTSVMIFVLINFCIILVLLLAFIFVGIKAFSLGGIMGSIVNSTIPASKITRILVAIAAFLPSFLFL